MTYEQALAQLLREGAEMYLVLSEETVKFWRCIHRADSTTFEYALVHRVVKHGIARYDTSVSVERWFPCDEFPPLHKTTSLLRSDD